MEGLLRPFVVLLGLIACCTPVHGTVHEHYRARIEAARALPPLGDAPFGERIDLHTGEVAFHQVDIVLEGTGPTIRIARTRPAVVDATHPVAAFGDWWLDVPRIDTLVATSAEATPGTSWRVEGTTDAERLARCSRFGAPHAGDAGVARDAWWAGYAVHLGDGQSHPLLRRAPAWTLRPVIAGEVPAITTTHVQIACLPSTRNGEPGEAFHAYAPDGTRYRFDWLVGRDAGTIVQGTRVQGRMHASMLASRVADRFGNWVEYRWDGPRLQSIQASDGRAVELAWNGDLIARITTHPGSDAPRTWHYLYAGRTLTGVVLPDASRWSFDLRATGGPGTTVPSDACTFRTASNASAGSGVTSTLSTPSGLTGTFVFEPRWHGRSRTPSTCENGQRESVPPMVSRLSLVRRTWSGPGVDARWEYRHGSAQGSTTRDACAIAGTCADTRWIDVIEPGGARVRHTTSTEWGALEGKRLRTETFDADGTLLRTERLSYATAETGAFVARIGTALRGATVNTAALETLVPLRERVITQQGVDFRWRVADCGGAPCFDALARPVSVERSGTRSRIDHTAYADNTRAWVLGQVASESTFDPGVGTDVELLRTEYDPTTALPLRHYVRGLLQETRTYFRDGNLATRSDGRDTPGFDTTVRYSGWTRGIPTRIAYPGGARARAGVEVDGTIRWVAAETGARTCYAYDPVGRLVRTTWPDEAQPTQCSNVHWNETTATFAQAPSGTTLLAAHHWMRTERTGNGVHLTWYDALWRPVLVEEHDAADIPGTRRTTRTAYDAAGRTTYRSFPSASAIPPSAGETIRYDALGRAIRTERTSELGPLVATIDYLDGFRMRATDARGYATTFTRLRAYDTPESPWPEAIAFPADTASDSLFVDIDRDIFDQPVRIVHRNVNGTIATTQHAVYDAHGRLCKTVSAEQGATVIGHDILGNVTWTAAGTAFDDTANCQHAQAHRSGQRIDRTWDARNRLATVTYPDGVGNQVRTYTADGRLHRITTYNARADDMVINTYIWNARRLLVDEWLSHPNRDTWHLFTAHDRNGHPAIVRYPNGTAVGLVPNALGQPTRVGNYVTNVRWHPDGALASFRYGNGIVHATALNARGLPEHRRDAHGTTLFHDERLDHDANGQLAAIRDGLPGARGDRLLVHDASGRLVRVESPLFATATFDHDALGRPVRTAIGGPHARTHHFCRDERGHVTNVKTVGCAHGPSIMGIERDGAGRLVRLDAQAFEYDGGHRLRAVSGIERYAYDGHDRRVRADSLRGGGTILSQYDRDGRLMWQSDERARLGKVHVHLGNRLIAIREQPLVGGAAYVRYQHTDGQGTPAAETGPDRTLLRRSEYEPFGKLLNRAETDGVGFRGWVTDRATGWQYAPGGYAHPLLPDLLGTCRWDTHAWLRCTPSGNSDMTTRDPVMPYLERLRDPVP